MTAQRSRISVVINTRNEERNLPSALRSVKEWADEIVVVDMESTDRTREIAAEHGAQVYLHENLGFADPARAFAVDKSHGEWVFILDADEVVPPALAAEMRRIVDADCYDIVRTPHLNYFFAEALLYTGWGPETDRHPRLFRRGKMKMIPRIHVMFEYAPDARVFDLPYGEGLAIVHFNYIDVEHFLDKLNRYTSIEARQLLERGVEHGPAKALGLAFKEWFKRYVSKRGYRDGWRGFYLSLLMAFYRISISAKAKQLREVGEADAIRERYRVVADDIIRGYGRDRDAS